MAITADRAAYHHGNLREALLEAGLELTRAGGASALVLRDVTRRVGVSPNAAYRHFADRGDLLAAVATRVQEQIAERMGDGPADGIPTSATSAEAARARAGLRAVGLGYIAFALAEPGWFEVAFAQTDPQLLADGAAPRSPASAMPPPMARLVAALDALVDAGALDPAHREGAEWPCWSAVHGFALLALHGPLRGRDAVELQIAAERTVDAIVAGVLA